jgi:transcriptional regulator with XRE-family HTH domain
MIPNRRPDALPFRDLLRQHRLAAGLTQEDLAERAEMSARGISDLERGVRTYPYRETVKLLADALGLSRAERSAFGLAARRPPRRGKASRGSPSALPIPLTPLIGRTQEQAAISSLLGDDAVRLVTLTGPGGVGKTRLALSVAERMADAFPDGVVFVDLAPLRDPDLVLSQVGTALGRRESPGEGFSEVIRGYLGAGHAPAARQLRAPAGCRT